ncbi:MAG: histidine kinase [Nostoc sp.]
MGHGAWGEKLIPNVQFPISNSQCPMSNAQFLILNAQCPMPNAQ